MNRGKLWVAKYKAKLNNFMIFSSIKCVFIKTTCFQCAMQSSVFIDQPIKFFCLEIKDKVGNKMFYFREKYIRFISIIIIIIIFKPVKSGVN